MEMQEKTYLIGSKDNLYDVDVPEFIIRTRKGYIVVTTLDDEYGKFKYHYEILALKEGLSELDLNFLEKVLSFGAAKADSQTAMSYARFVDGFVTEESLFDSLAFKEVDFKLNFELEKSFLEKNENTNIKKRVLPEFAS